MVPPVAHAGFDPHGDDHVPEPHGVPVLVLPHGQRDSCPPVGLHVPESVGHPDDPRCEAPPVLGTSVRPLVEDVVVRPQQEQSVVIVDVSRCDFAGDGGLAVAVRALDLHGPARSDPRILDPLGVEDHVPSEIGRYPSYGIGQSGFGAPAGEEVSVPVRERQGHVRTVDVAVRGVRIHVPSVEAVADGVGFHVGDGAMVLLGGVGYGDRSRCDND